jgi:general secretion pathway protein E
MNYLAANRVEDHFLLYLAEIQALDPISLQRVSTAVKATGHAVDTILLELGLMEEVKLADVLSQYLGLERISSSEFPFEIPAKINVSPELLLRANVLPIVLTDEAIVLAVARPLEDATARSIGYHLDKKVIIKVAVGSELSQHLTSLFAQTGASAPEFGETALGHDLASDDVDKLRDIASEAPVISLLSRLAATAVDRGASDIHVEPLEDQVRIRYRIDGALQTVEALERGLHLALVSRIKILARLNIAEQRLPQDGRIRLAVRGRDIDLRVSTSPTLHGEGVVLRILDRKNVVLDFKFLGYDDSAVAKLRRILSMPNGVLLVTGPTGSGKTTTLYAALTQLNHPSSKIFTIEDPIEYQLKGTSQILVRPQIGLDFAAIIRSVLRQDPDIIMVGEIRDAETAKIAVQASLTGHLVLSTLHTNSAASSITRLRNIGIESFLLAACVRGIVAQRLIRKLCPHCKAPSPFPADLPNARGSGSRAQSAFAPVGCNKCHGAGYSGRTVIYEILEVTDKIRSAIVNDAPDVDIDELARKDGMASLYECGVNKVRAGETSLEEIIRTMSGAEV